MSFIIALILGFYIGFKLKSALIFLKETRNIKYIEKVVKTVLSNEEFKIYKSDLETQTEKENIELERKYKLKKVRG